MNGHEKCPLPSRRRPPHNKEAVRSDVYSLLACPARRAACKSLRSRPCLQETGSAVNRGSPGKSSVTVSRCRRIGQRLWRRRFARVLPVQDVEVALVPPPVVIGPPVHFDSADKSNSEKEIQCHE